MTLRSSWIMREVTRGMALAAALLLLTPAQAMAQSHEPWSIQFSGEGIFPTKSYGDVLQRKTSPGWEVQLRRTFGRFSIGAGFERSRVFQSDAADLTGTLAIGFLEPRYVITLLGDHLAFYGAARLGYGDLQIRDTPSVDQHSVSYGAGLGFLFSFSNRLSLDLGGQYFLADFGGNQGTAGYALARLGLAIGLF